MKDLLLIASAILAAVGGFVLFVALFTPRRFVARRPRRFITGFSLLALSALLAYSGGMTG